jgi:glycosyltransferase involved in cell wall biosynthesis
LNVAILTRNAIHGGVETMIATHQEYLDADVFVTGGHNTPDTCPFSYTYVTEADADPLANRLGKYDVVIYHWVPPWAVVAVSRAGVASIEFVHRVDNADSDKTVPTLLATHSRFLADHVRKVHRRECVVIPHGIDVARFPERSDGTHVGGLTSYFPTKGIDVFLRAWSTVQRQRPGLTARFYGAGDELPRCRQMVDDLGLPNVELLGPAYPPERHLPEFAVVVVPSLLEGMPLAILEALACNIPVVCSNLPGMVEFNQLAVERGLEPTPLTLARSGDADDLADKIVAALDGNRRDTRAYVGRWYGADANGRAVLVACGQAMERAAQDALRLSAPDLDDLRWLAAIVHRFRSARVFPYLRRVWRRVE